MGLVRLHPREVGSFALREAVLAVELELRGDDGVLSPAVHVKRRLGENESSGVRDGRLGRSRRGSANRPSAKVDLVVRVRGSVPVSGGVYRSRINVLGSRISEETIGINVRTTVGRDRPGPTERVDGVGESIDRISVVEGLGSKNPEEGGIASQGRAIVDVLVGLNDPNELFHGVIEVELDLVGRRSNRLVTSELELSDQILVRVLGHPAALIRVQKHIIDVERSGNEGLVVGNRGRNGLSGRRLRSGSGIRVLIAVQRRDGPEALVDGANVEVDLDLVVLEGNQREGKSGVGAEPELEGNVESRFGEGIAGSANLARSHGVAGTVDLREGRIGDEGELGGVPNHLEVSALLLTRHGELVPDVHPVAVLAVDALTPNLNLDLSDELLSGEVQPTGVNTGVLASRVVTKPHKLVNLGESNLKVGAVSKISVPADHALDTATEIGLSVESLFDRLNREVRVPAVRHLPESNLRVTSKVNILSAIGYELHKTTSHFYTIPKEKKIWKTTLIR